MHKFVLSFCDFFKPRAGAHQHKDDGEAREARARLAELFGEEQQEADTGEHAESKSEADRALKELKRLFGED